MLEVEEVRDRLETLERQIFRTAWGPEMPEAELYHYTCEGGLDGILSSGQVWATAITYMNDQEELSYGNKLVEERYLGRIENAGTEINWLGNFKPSLYALRGIFNIYAFSLTELEDDRDTWLNYGDDGRGYAIGFNPTAVGEDRILKVVYKRKDQELVVDQVLEPAFIFLRWLYAEKFVVESESEGKKLLLDFVVTLQKALAITTLRFKDTIWDHEKEWRFIGIGSPEGHRAWGLQKIPYQSFVLNEFSPSTIRIGPLVPEISDIGPLTKDYPLIRLERSKIILHSKTFVPRPAVPKYKMFRATRLLTFRCIRGHLRRVVRSLKWFIARHLSSSECPCGTAVAPSEGMLTGFQEVRNVCAALKCVLVPDWSTFEQADNSLEGNRATHRSMLLLAFERRHLSRITSPVHRYLIISEEVRDNVAEQYRQDLQEKWQLKAQELDRHRRAKSFLGKIVELQFADWIESQGWVIQDLEAWGGNSDVTAMCPWCFEWSFEVKYIGVEDWDFQDILKSLDGVGSGRPLSLHTVSDFFLFRTYEAANQLSEVSEKEKCAVVVIDDQTWARFEFVLRNGFTDWRDPSFTSNDPQWLRFLEGQKKKYPDVETEVRQVIAGLSEIWVLKLCHGFQYSKEYSFSPGHQK